MSSLKILSICLLFLLALGSCTSKKSARLGNPAADLPSEEEEDPDVEISSNAKFIQLVAGAAHVCGLSDNGKAYCWGWDSSGQLGENADGDDLDEEIPVAVDTSNLTSGARFISLVAGHMHTCGLASDGKAYCWGDDTNGQLGDDVALSNKNIPTAVDTSNLSAGAIFTSLMGGRSHTCGLTSDGKTYCWGSDDSGQLGESADGDDLDEPIPVAVDTSALTAGASFVALVGGGLQAPWSHTCGLSSDGKAYCWGSDIGGQLGENVDLDNADENIPTLVDTSALDPGTSFVAVSAGRVHTCGLTNNGKIFCWGLDSNGQLGDDGVVANKSIPTAVDTSGLPAGTNFKKIYAGNGHSCALASNGKAYCWGQDQYGQLGENADGDNATEFFPVEVDTSNLSAGASFTHLALGYSFSCGLTTGGNTYCWGGDDHGQLGENADGDNLSENIPVLVNMENVSDADGPSFTQLSLGGLHSCGLTSHGKAYCWGGDAAGQLGENADGDNTNELTPVLVDTSTLTAGSQFLSISAGGLHSCGVASDGKAYCWGYDVIGQLGENADGDNLNENIPVEVDTSILTAGSQFVSVKAGHSDHSCGVASDGKAYCWGYDDFAQLGDGGGALSTNTPSAVDLSPLTAGSSLLSIVLGEIHSCSLASDGKAYCWGYDQEGQLGENADGDNGDEFSPSLVDYTNLTAGASFVSVTTTSYYHSCGLASDGKAYCWGWDQDGQLGNGGAGDSYIPTAVDTSSLPAGFRFTSITGGYGHTCGLGSNLKAYCWGNDFYGQVGDSADGDNADEQSPVEVDTSNLASGEIFISIIASSFHTCGLSSHRKTYCWGRNSSGELGIGTTTNSNVPVLVNTSGL